MLTTGNFYGHSFGRSSQAEAKREVLANCNRQPGVADACEMATWFSDGCGALAIGYDGAWDADRAKTTAEASAKALKAFAPRTIAAHVQWSLFIASAAGLAKGLLSELKASYKDGGVPPLPTALSSVS